MGYLMSGRLIDGSYTKNMVILVRLPTSPGWTERLLLVFPTMAIELHAASVMRYQDVRPSAIPGVQWFDLDHL